MSWTGAMVGSARLLKQMSKTEKSYMKQPKQSAHFAFLSRRPSPVAGANTTNNRKNLFKAAQQIGSFRFSLSPKVR
jgi:hypothetical protein